jgi:hypothetical protein
MFRSPPNGPFPTPAYSILPANEVARSLSLPSMVLAATKSFFFGKATLTATRKVKDIRSFKISVISILNFQFWQRTSGDRSSSTFLGNYGH